MQILISTLWKMLFFPPRYMWWSCKCNQKRLAVCYSGEFVVVPIPSRNQLPKSVKQITTSRAQTFPPSEWLEASGRSLCCDWLLGKGGTFAVDLDAPATAAWWVESSSRFKLRAWLMAGMIIHIDEDQTMQMYGNFPDILMDLVTLPWHNWV